MRRRPAKENFQLPSEFPWRGTSTTPSKLRSFHKFTSLQVDSDGTQAYISATLRPSDGPMSEVRVPLSYLLSTSRKGLEAFEQNRLSHAANIDKEIKSLTLEANRARAEGDVARWLIENREEMLRSVGDHLEKVTEVVRKEVA